MSENQCSDRTPFEPIYLTAEDTTEIPLAENEPVEVTFPSMSPQPAAGTCRVTVEWGAQPSVLFDVSLEPPPEPFFGRMYSSGRTFTVRFPARGTSVEAVGRGGHVSLIDGAMRLLLVPLEVRIRPSTAIRVAAVTFHVPNFSSFYFEFEGKTHFGMLELPAGEWLVRLAPVDMSGRKEDVPLRESRITHFGQIARADGADFELSEALELLDALQSFLSFAKGQQLTLMLPVAFDATGTRVWGEWTGAFAGLPMDRPPGWMDRHHGEVLGEVFPGFWRTWNRQEWRYALGRAVAWYLRSNAARPAFDVGIILSQAALELLAWTFFVEDRCDVRAEGFKELKAHGQIRLLLSTLRIPRGIPGQLSDLAKVGAAFNLKDGPDALTQVRNSFVHANANRQQRYTAVVGDTWMLAQWYCELVILNLCGHRGLYRDRIAAIWPGQVCPVPWA